MSWTYNDAKAMYDTAQRTGNKLHIQLGTIYSPEARAARKIIDDGHLGDIYFARTIHYRRRGRPYVDGYGTPAFVNTGTSGGGAMLDGKPLEKHMNRKKSCRLLTCLSDTSQRAVRRLTACTNRHKSLPVTS